MSRLLIIGYGNPLRGDDGFGLALAQRLQDEFRDTAAIEIIASHQLALEFAEPLSRAQRALFIDASAGGAPGEIVFQTIEPAPGALTRDVPARFTHHLSAQTLLAYAQYLYGARPPDASLLSVGGENFGYSQDLTEPVAAALERAHTLVAQAASLAGCDPPNIHSAQR